jgi:hypothetical protein
MAYTMPENKKIAAELVERDAKKAIEFLNKLDMPVQIAPADTSDWPAGDGEGMLAPITIGTRDHLTKREARKNAALWRKARRRYPKATFIINMLGFNEDPRGIHEVPEAARFVRWWARYAGMDDPREVEQYLADQVDAARFEAWNGSTAAEANVGLLASCGVYGATAKAHVLRGQSPIKAN